MMKFLSKKISAGCLDDTELRRDVAC